MRRRPGPSVPTAPCGPGEKVLASNHANCTRRSRRWPRATRQRSRCAPTAASCNGTAAPGRDGCGSGERPQRPASAGRAFATASAGRPWSGEVSAWPSIASPVRLADLAWPVARRLAGHRKRSAPSMCERAPGRRALAFTRPRSKLPASFLRVTPSSAWIRSCRRGRSHARWSAAWQRCIGESRHRPDRARQRLWLRRRSMLSTTKPGVAFHVGRCATQG